MESSGDFNDEIEKGFKEMLDKFVSTQTWWFKVAGEKEIKNKISSIQNTQKITKAMEMVAASKMKKAQDRMSQARPYAEIP